MVIRPVLLKLTRIEDCLGGEGAACASRFWQNPKIKFARVYPPRRRGWLIHQVESFTGMRRALTVVVSDETNSDTCMRPEIPLFDR